MEASFTSASNVITYNNLRVSLLPVYRSLERLIRLLALEASAVKIGSGHRYVLSAMPAEDWQYLAVHSCSSLLSTSHQHDDNMMQILTQSQCVYIRSFQLTRSHFQDLHNIKLSMPGLQLNAALIPNTVQHCIQ